MIKHLTAAALVCLLELGASAQTDAPLGCAADILADIRRKDTTNSTPFALTATVTVPTRKHNLSFNVEDDSGQTPLSDHTLWPKRLLKVGDVIRASGVVLREWNGRRFAHIRKLDVIGRRTPSEPSSVTLAQILDGSFFYRVVRTEGTVIDAFKDEIDPHFFFLVLADGRDTLCANFFNEGPEPDFDRLIDARISLTGFANRSIDSRTRTHSGTEIANCDSQSIRILRPAPKSPFDVPLLEDDPDGIGTAGAGLPYRRKVRGQVIAVWHGNKLLVWTERGKVSKVELTSRKDAPSYGTFIEAVGIPETDLYHLNLSRAVWRAVRGTCPPQPEPEAVTAGKMLTDGKGEREIKAYYHGRTIRMTGTINALPAVGNGDHRTNLECGEYQIPLDFSSAPEALARLSAGCKAEVTGTCVMELENCRPQAPFPHIEGFAIVVRTPDDVRILARPPWWTPARLLVVIGSLLAALIAILVWNAVLRKLVERRGRQLFKAQISKAESELRIDERTRLAVELHDSISQNLTGVALEINSADRLSQTDAAAAHRHLDRAAMTLRSCRNELKNCLWDLRNATLENHDLDEAIRQTLAPHVGDAQLAVRFNVPRRLLTDNTAHAILRIIRELAVNAVRHGQARTIRVAGSREDGRLLFSVRDDGRGFDPRRCPGVAEGHFGLQGILERVEGLEGELNVRSAPGRGTKVTVALPLAQPPQL